MKRKVQLKALIVLFFLLFFASCAKGGDEDAGNITPETTPTATEAPMAARVNGEGILLSEYESELQRYQAGAAEAGVEVSPGQARDDVLAFLVEQTLFRQTAVENGYAQTEEEVSRKIASLVEARGGQAEFDAYLAQNFYSQESMRAAVARDLAVIWMRNFLISQIPTMAEQVHARQILVDSENAAIAVLRRLEVGTPFTDLAYEYDPLTAGDLGWFPRGYLFQPAVEEAAFALQPGQFSGIIPTDIGFHIVEVIERETQRELSADALLKVRQEAISVWLEEQKSQSLIEVIVT